MSQSMKSNLLATSTLFSALMGAVVPDGRWMVFYSMAAATITVLLLRLRTSKLTFLGAYAVLLPLGFLLSHYFYEDGSVNRVGMLILWPVLIGTGCFVYKVFRDERAFEVRDSEKPEARVE